MKLVLLPGMDGTGLLFQPLLRELPLDLSTQVITYSTHNKQDYSELLSEIKNQLPKTPFILLAESFSGALAHCLSLDASLPIEKIILIASFLQNPRPKLLWLTKLLPVNSILSIAMPRLVMGKFCFGGKKTYLEDLLRQSIKLVQPNVLVFRLRLILELQAPREISKVNCLIINPSSDKLVAKRVSLLIQKSFQFSEVIELDGPHFLAQVATNKLSQLIIKYSKSQ